MSSSLILRSRWLSALLAILLLLVLCPAWSHAAAPFPEFIDPHPNPGNKFGHSVVALSTGNVVITSPFDDAGGTDAGAVYLFNGATGVLISTLKGSQTNDSVGSGGVTALSNGNYVVVSEGWDNAAVVNAGAATWGNGTSGVSGTVSSSNSLVGTRADDQVGITSVTALSNGNYVVCSESWDNASAVNAGAVTWGNGASGVSGTVSSSNSLVGTRAGDEVGNWGVTLLANGNYVVRSPFWDNGTVTNAGAVSWGSGSSGVKGAVNSSNSLVGTQASDNVGNSPVTALSNGNYVVTSAGWDNATVVGAGAVTWGSGTSGVKGAITSSNSLVGTQSYDIVGSNGVVALSNGNYVVRSPYWNNSGVDRAGAVTWGSGTSGVSGVVSISNSLVGTTVYDGVGISSVTALSNGNYVVCSENWDNAGVENVGAATWCNGNSGSSGVVSSTNSLVGTTANDHVGCGFYGVKALINGHYVVRSPLWDKGAAADVGAVTWGSGTSGVTGAVSISNSLVGITANDQVGSTGVVALSNGNYVVISENWRKAGVVAAGAVTWCGGTSRGAGVVSSSNSLVGTKANDQVGSTGVVALSNGNYVVISANWDNSAVADAGAVTWGSGSSGVKGAVTSSNSLFGITANDRVGSGGVTALSSGSYVVASPNWDNAGAADAGAVTWGSGSNGMKGAVSISNSLVGLVSNSGLQDLVVDDVNGNWFGRFLDEGSGRVRLSSQVEAIGSLRPQVTRSIVFTPPLKLYLDESPFILSASTSSGQPIFYTVVSGPATVSGNVLTLTDIGVVKLRASQPGDANSPVATAVERTITVADFARPVTLTNLSQTYNGTPRPVAALGTAGPVEVTYKVGPVYVPEAPINVGSYAVKAVAGGITKTGTLVIAKAALFVTPDDQRKFVGQANPVLGFSYSGFLGGDNAANSVSKTPVIATTATATSPGGFYPISASGGASANYIFVYQRGTMKVETFAGSYEALLVDAGRPSAKLELTVAASSKSFTAKLTTPTETAAVALNGTLGAPALNETTTGTATVKKGANTYLVTVTLPLTGDFTAEAKLNGATLGTALNGRKLLTVATGQTLSYTGTHSALLAPATVGTGVPAGAGWAVATIDAKGLLKLAGKLADGTTLTASLAADVSSNPGYRLFLQPYVPARTGAFIAGAFALKPQLDPGLTGRRYVAFEDAADLTWVKARRDLDTSYRAGFGPVDTLFTLDPWLPPVVAKVGVPAITLTNRLGLTAPQFTAQHSTIISASFIDLPTTLGLNATTNAVSVIAPVTTPANTTKWKVILTPATGAFVGSFELNENGKKRPVPFTGMMRQPVNNTDTFLGDGHFLLPSLTPLTNNEILSGEVGFEK